MIDFKGHDQGKDDSGVEKAPAWLLSFADVSALLLAFFVMLFSMSTLKTEEYEKIISKITVKEKQEDPVRDLAPIASESIQMAAVLPAEAPEYLERILAEAIESDPVLEKARITLLNGRIIMSLPAEELFLPGSAIISSRATAALFNLSGVMSQFGNQVVVAGHTDPTPTRADIYPSNWELSLARALSVASYLKDVGYQQELTIMGHADSQYEYLNQSIPEDRRKKLARRVDLVIYPEAGS
ncbi:OmpA/MotB family protein [Curvivirga aplysinae]|uniref:OmpA/MotB family protein n=1 Tax=Curvivirga aplysinae TaxID=2529852 RepID=UPI0012BD6492|nr:flagellar motor protein MotB [Curvivirga aplysinae]MTI11239.1 chemotaxis protein MotB [Curvivirga aplysinae]